MATDPKIGRRDDVSPAEGEHTYGDVNFADRTNTPEHIRAAWSYINHKGNAAKYDAKANFSKQFTSQWQFLLIYLLNFIVTISKLYYIF